MSDKNAKIQVGLEGADQVKEQAKKVESAFDAIGSTLADLSKKASNAQSSILGIKDTPLTQTIDDVKSLDAAYTKLALETGRSIAEIRRANNDLAKSFGVPQEQLVKQQIEVGRYTGNYKAAIDTQKQYITYAQNTGRKPEEVSIFQESLIKDYGITTSKETTNFLAALRKEAKEKEIPLPTLERSITNAGPQARYIQKSGGPAGVLDVITKANEQFKNPDIANDVVNSYFGLIRSRFQDIERFLPGGLKNIKKDVGPNGELSPELAQTLVDKISKGIPEPNRRLSVLTSLFGGNPAAAQFALNYRLPSKKSFPEAPEEENLYVNTPTGLAERRKIIEKENERSSAIAREVTRANQKYTDYYVNHPEEAYKRERGARFIANATGAIADVLEPVIGKGGSGVLKATGEIPNLLNQGQFFDYKKTFFETISEIRGKPTYRETAADASDRDLDAQRAHIDALNNHADALKDHAEELRKGKGSSGRANEYATDKPNLGRN